MRSEPQTTASDAAFKRAFAKVLRRYDGAFKAMADGDKRPTRTDSCCRADGTCNGSCAAPRR